MKGALRRLFPAQVDQRFHGRRAALWLLGLSVALKLVMSINSILNTEAVAVGADGFPIASFDPAAARAVLMLFALTALGQLSLALIALVALIRYRGLIPFVYLVLIGEQLARRLIVDSYAVARAEGSGAGWYVNAAILALLAIGLALSLIDPRSSTEPKAQA